MKKLRYLAVFFLLVGVISAGCPARKTCLIEIKENTKKTVEVEPVVTPAEPGVAPTSTDRGKEIEVEETTEIQVIDRTAVP